MAGWAVVVGMAISVRANEVRVAQQLGTLASFPPLVVVVLFGAGVIHPTFKVAIVFAVGLLAIDLRGTAHRRPDVRPGAPRHRKQRGSILNTCVCARTPEPLAAVAS